MLKKDSKPLQLGRLALKSPNIMQKNLMYLYLLLTIKLNLYFLKIRQTVEYTRDLGFTLQSQPQ